MSRTDTRPTRTTTRLTGTETGTGTGTRTDHRAVGVRAALHTRLPVRRAATAAAACAAVLGLCAAATAPATATPSTMSAGAGTVAASTTAADQSGRYTAHEIRTFLKVFYGEHGPGRFARMYGVSDALKEKAAQQPDYDVLLCAQNTPQAIDIGPVTTAQSAGVGWATVTTHWAAGATYTGVFTAYVDLDASRPIQLLDVVCDTED